MGVISRLLGAPRNTEITTAQGLDRLLRGGGATWSGMSVTPDNALQVATVFACTRLIAEDIGKLPFPVYRKRAGDPDWRDRATDSPFWRLVHDRPNSFQSSQQFRELLTAHAVLRGNGYAFKNRVRGEVRELLPIRPDRVTVEQGDDYELIYHVRMSDGVVKDFTRRDIFHLAGLSLDGVTGVSVITYARQTIGLAMATERHGAKFFANGAHPGGAYRHPGPKGLSDQAFERLQEQLSDLKGEGAHGTLVLEEGMDWVQIGLSNEDSQFVDTAKATAEVIAGQWFRVPPHKVGLLDRSTNNNIEHQQLEYEGDTLLSWAMRWQHALNDQVIGPGETYAEMLFDALLRADTKTRYQAYQVAVGRPWMSGNEARRRENLPPVDGLDEVFEPLNMQPAGAIDAKRELAKETADAA